MKKIWEKYGFKLPAAAVLLGIAVICLYRMFQPGALLNFGPEQLIVPEDGALYFEAGVLEDNEPGWYVDNGMDYGETFAVTPKVDLGIGSYDITIFYMAGGGDSFYSISAQPNTYRVLLGRQKEKLETGRVSKTLTVNYLEKLDGFEVATGYGGAGYLIINGIEIRQTRDLEKMLIFSVCFLLLCGFVWEKIKKSSHPRHSVIIGLAVAAAASLPIMMPYLNRADDMMFHLLRIEGIAQGLKSGQLPVRIQPQWMNGYGYPVSVFYGEGVLCVAGLLRYIGFPLQLSYKLYIVFLNLLTFWLSAYSFQRIVKDRRVAMLGGAFYTIAPYRLMNIYLRAAVGEYTALTFLPLVLTGVYEILMEEDKERKKYSWMILAAGMTGIIQSHILTLEIVGIFLVVVCVIFWKRTFSRTGFPHFLKAAAATILINLSFLVPFLDYMRDDFYVNSGDFGSRIQTNGVFLDQLLAIFPHGYGFERSVVEGINTEAEKTFAIGFVFVLGIIAFFLLKQKFKDRERKAFRFGSFCCIAAIVLLAMSTIWFPWDILYDSCTAAALLISKLQFPWRLHGAASVLLSALLCIVLVLVKRLCGRPAVMITGGILLTASILSTGYFYSTMMESNNYLYIADIGSVSSFELVSGEYVPAGVDWKREKMPEGKLWHNELVSVGEHEKQGTNYRMTVANFSQELQSVELPMLYYRGFVASDTETGLKLKISAGENGRISIELPGDYLGTVKVKFQEPLPWRLSELITLMSIAGLLFYIARDKRLIRIKVHGDK